MRTGFFCAMALSLSAHERLPGRRLTTQRVGPPPELLFGMEGILDLTFAFLKSSQVMLARGLMKQRSVALNNLGILGKNWGRKAEGLWAMGTLLIANINNTSLLQGKRNCVFYKIKSRTEKEKRKVCNVQYTRKRSVCMGVCVCVCARSLAP